MDVFLNAWRRVETWLAVALIAAALAHAGVVAAAMATSSLSTDEFGTVGTFSSRGPVRVLTDYRAPKNHIFFNLLNSVLPARDSWNPARVRALAILATLLTGALIVGYAARRGQLLEGGVIVALWSLAPEMLTLSMEARGYGFLGLFAVLAAIATMEYLRTARRGWLIALAAAATLGVYTVPSFLLFAAPLLLGLWLARRTRETFVAGAGTAAAILLLYAPVLRQLVAAFTEFQSSDENGFVEPDSLWRAVRLYVLPVDNWQAALLLAGLLAMPFVVARWRPRGERLGPCLVALAGAVFLATLVALRTPPLRVAACGLLPIMLSGILAAGAGLRMPGGKPLRPLVFGLVGATLLLGAIRALVGFDFLPTENWTLAARAIDAAFPRAVRVDFARHAKYLKQTLPDSRERSAPFDPSAFEAGQLVVADAGNKWAEGRRFSAPPGLSRVVEWTVPGRIRDVVLSYRVPAEFLDAGERVFQPGTPLPSGGIAIPLQAPPGAHALVVLLDRPVTARDLAVETPGAFLAGNAVVLPLTGTTPPSTLALRSRAAGLQISHAWISR